MRRDTLASLRQLSQVLGDLPVASAAGTVRGVAGLAIDIAGLAHHAAIGQRVAILGAGDAPVLAEILGFSGGTQKAMTLGHTERIKAGMEARIVATARRFSSGEDEPFADRGGLLVSEGWLGRVVDPFGAPLDGKGYLPAGPRACALRAPPPPATSRARLGGALDLGVRVLNTFATASLGQRLGLFAASGVGKSTLLSMIARHTECDVVVLALIGERGREVREFIEEHLGAEKMARSVVVVATSDAPPLARRESAHAAMAIAEYFRDEGQSVLLVMDSVTRYCQSLREIALSAGEFPAARGYPASVFTELPRLLERAGPGAEGTDGSAGFITGIFTVLVDGDDHDEPIADAVRGILDGHIVLARRIAEAGRYPPVDVARSLSRTMEAAISATDMALAQRGRALLARHAELARLIEMGVYEAGRNAEFDQIVAKGRAIEALLAQPRAARVAIEESFADLAQVIGTGSEPENQSNLKNSRVPSSRLPSGGS
jgi:flagellum-specific ATP synthase